MRMRLRFAALIVCLLAGPAAMDAQQQAAAVAPAPNIRIIAAGGFLGYLDGLVAEDKTYGGLLGFERFLNETRRQPDDLLLITGNNMPHTADSPFDGGWQRIGAMKPDAVALSIDDFRRALRRPGGVVAFMKALPQAGAIPLVASNAIIKARRTNLNAVSMAGFELEIAEHESVAWLTKVRVSGGRCADVTSGLRDVTTPAIPAPAIAGCTDATDDHFDLTFASPLRPGRHYELTVTTTATPERKAVFTFYTHRALLPLGSTDGQRQVPAELVDLPVRYVTRTLAGADHARLIIVSVVDPETRKRLGADRWQWTSADADCDGDRCELDFLPPQDALAAIAAAIGGAPAMRPDPIFIVMSGLYDSSMLTLMSELPSAPGHAPDVPIAAPFVLLDPDTRVLGVDVGHTSIVRGDTVLNGGTPTADPARTQIWARPPWIGARADLITGRLAWTGRWELTVPDATVMLVPGDRAALPAPAQAGRVTYTLNPSSTTLGPYEAYGEYKGPALDANGVWQSLAVLLLDIMRREAHADIAILPRRFIDADIVGEVAAATAKPPVVFTRFLLGKLLYEQESMVSVDIEGSKLAAALDALVKARTQAREELFIAGVGTAGLVSQIDPNHLLVNGRAIVGDHFYKVAMPQSLAQAQGLMIVDEEAVLSLLDAADAHMRTRGGAVLRASGEMAELENRFAGRPLVYLNVSPAKFSYYRGSPTNHKLLGNIPLAGRAVKDERQWSVSARGDLALDGVHWALRAVGDLKFAKNVFAEPPTYPEDEWTAGVRGDLKLAAGVGRLFGGRFRQSQIREQRFTDVAPTRTVPGTVTTTDGQVLTGATVGGQPVTIDNQNRDDPDKPAYVFNRVGADVTTWNLSPWLALKDATAAFDWGTAHNSRDTVVLSGVGSFPIREVYRHGLDQFLAQQFAAHPAPFAEAQVLTFTHRDHRQRRVQLDGTLAYQGQPTWPRWTRASTVSLVTQVRRYFDEEIRPDFTPSWSLEMKTQVEWTVLRRLKAGPYFNYYRVDVKWPDDVEREKKPLDYVKVGIELTLPIFLSRGPARTFQ